MINPDTGKEFTDDEIAGLLKALTTERADREQQQKNMETELDALTETINDRELRIKDVTAKLDTTALALKKAQEDLAASQANHAAAEQVVKDREAKIEIIGKLNLRRDEVLVQIAQEQAKLAELAKVKADLEAQIGA